MSAVAHIDEYKTGTFYTDEFRGGMSWNGWETNTLLRNNGCTADGPRFTDVSSALGAGQGGDARGIAVADYDNDGDLDLAINHNPGDNERLERRAAVLLENRIAGARGWLAVELTGTASNRDAVGAVVIIEAGDLEQMRQVTAGSSYASQHSQRLYFGVGESNEIERLTVIWPSGTREEYTKLPARTLLRAVEGGGLEVLELAAATDRAAPASGEAT